MNQKMIFENIVECLQQIVELMFSKNIPWEELNNSYVESGGTFKGTKFENQPKLQALFRMQLNIDMITEELEKDD